MRTTTVRLAALTALLALLLGGAVTAGEPAKPADQKKPAEEKKPSQLEELIAQALRDNPDIRVAEAKTREAEAELNRARLQVIQKVVAHQHTVETLESAVKVAEANYVVAEAKLKLSEADLKRMTELHNRNAVAASVLDQAQATLEQARANVETAKAGLQAAKADLAKARAELPYLLGKGTKDDTRTEAMRALYALSIAKAESAWKTGEQPRGTVADKLRKALNKTTSLDFVEGQRLGSLLDVLQEAAGVPMVTTLPRDTKLLSVRIQNVPLGAAFQAVEDVAGVRFAVRDYGILVSDKLPSGVTRLHDFWKGSDKPGTGDEKPKSGPEKP